MPTSLTTRLAAILLIWLAISRAGQAAEPFDNDPRYLEAAAQFANGHYVQAIPRLMDLLARYPQHARLQIMAADAFERTGQLAAARELYRAALASKPDPKAETIATEGAERLARLIEQPTTQPAAASTFELTADQVAAMSVIYPDQAHRKTEHFQITTNNPGLADALAQRVEAAFERVRRIVPTQPLFPHSVELIVYPNEAAMQKVYRVAEWSGGGYFFAPQIDGTVRRVVLLYQVDDQNRFRTALLTHELPHELAHVVIKEYFGQTPCPTWLDEGLACICEADGGKEKAEKMGEMLAQQKATPLADMIDRVKPPMDRPVAFYTQAASWTRFLHSSLSDGQMKNFLAQVKDGTKPSVAIGRLLVLDDQPGWLGAMEERWHKSVAEQK